MFIKAPLGLHENLYPSGLSEASGAGKPKNKYNFFHKLLCTFIVFIAYFFWKNYLHRKIQNFQPFHHRYELHQNILMPVNDQYQDLGQPKET